MRRRWCYLGILSIAILALGVGLAGGVVLDRWLLSSIPVPAAASNVPMDVPSEALSDLQLIAEAWNAIHRSYVDRSALGSPRLTYGAISGMVEALGDTGHSRFLSPDMRQEQHNFNQGQFEGIGAEVRMQDGYVVIVAPLDDSPAQRAGLNPGDIILKVDGQETTGLSLVQVVEHILGPAGTSVTLTILDAKTGGSREVTLERARINLRNVTWQRLPGTTVAHVRLSAFSQGVTEELRKALRDIQRQKLSGVILDVRNNPGGLFDEAINTASQFLEGGNVLLRKDAQGQITPVPVRSGGLAPDIPVMVLINRGTASASEIVAGALQGASRAPLVGETTFGTGTVLEEFSLSDGSSLLLATEEWLTPNGRTIWHQGLSPDVEMALPEGGALLLPARERDMTPDQLRTSGDTQLLKALELLAQPE